MDLSFLKNSVAVITGGYSGIGLGLAKQSIDKGCSHIALLDVDDEAGPSAVEELKKLSLSVEVLTVHCDVTDGQSVADSATKIKSTWPQTAIGLLCCNAGVFPVPGNRGTGLAGTAGVLESSIKDWQFTMNVNVYGVVHCLKTFVPILQTQSTKSAIINTSSGAGILWATHGPYAVSKHACAALTEALYGDLKSAGHKHISVHCLCPSIIATNIFRAERNRPAALVDAADREKHDGGMTNAGSMSGATEKEKLSAAMQQAAQEMYAEEGLSADDTARIAFEQLAEAKFWLIVDNPPPMQIDVKAQLGRRMASLLTQYPIQDAPKGAVSYMGVSLQRRVASIMSKL